MIPYGKQDITQQDIDAVIDVLNSDYLTQGPQVPLFEDKIKEAVGSTYACVVNSATSALHIACLALGVGKGDTVWTTPISFVASSNCALYCGSSIDFVDICPRTYNLCAKSLQYKLEHASSNGLPLPKVVIPVHLSGHPCEMDKIKALSNKYGFSLIEDASHAIGSVYQNQPIGNCEFSDITIFSFHPVKIVTTAEGGAAMTNNKSLSDRMHLLRSHGITRDNRMMTSPSHGDWYYQQIELGFNYRMSDIHAAIGVSQLSRLQTFVEKRNHLANRYDEHLQDLPITLPHKASDAYSARHLYIIRLQLENIALTKKEVFDQLRTTGVGVNVHYIPIHTQPYYHDLGFREGDFPEAERYYREAISLPLFHTLPIEHQDSVIASLRKILS